MKWKRLAALVLSFAVMGAAAFAANDYYTHGGFPATGASLSSASMRAELDLIMAGFDKFPTLSGAANKAVVINSGATGLTTTTGTMALTGNFSIAGNLTTTGAFNTSFTQGASTTLILPVVNGTLATLAGTETLTTKTINLSSNTLTGTTAQFNTALSDNDFATLAGAESLSNKTLPAPTFSGTAAGSLTSLALTTPVFTGSITGTYTLAGTPTITAPVLSGTATGTYTLAGTPTITAPTISGPTLSGTVLGTYTLGGTPSISTINLTGGQIAFPAVQSSSAGANILDDYEEGTWTPRIRFGANETGVTYDLQQGDYVKVGRVVMASFRITLTNNGSGTGSADLVGLPFTVINSISALGMMSNCYFDNTSTAMITLNLFPTANSTGAIFGSRTAAGTGSGAVPDHTDIGNTTTIACSLNYISTQ